MCCQRASQVLGVVQTGDNYCCARIIFLIGYNSQSLTEKAVLSCRSPTENRVVSAEHNKDTQISLRYVGTWPAEK